MAPADKDLCKKCGTALPIKSITNGNLLITLVTCPDCRTITLLKGMKSTDVTPRDDQ